MWGLPSKSHTAGPLAALRLRDGHSVQGAPASAKGDPLSGCSHLEEQQASSFIFLIFPAAMKSHMTHASQELAQALENYH